MKIEYDEDVDAIYLEFSNPNNATRTLDINGNIAIDLDRAGKLIGIEILGASKILNLETFRQIALSLPARYTPSKLIQR